MTFGGPLIDNQALSNFSIRQALGDEVRHLHLPLGQGWNSGLAQRWEAEEAAD